MIAKQPTVKTISDAEPAAPSCVCYGGDPLDVKDTEHAPDCPDYGTGTPHTLAVAHEDAEELYAVYQDPAPGYAADAHRATLEEAQRVAEGFAETQGVETRGLGWDWRVKPLDGINSAWSLYSKYDWARPTGISIEGPTTAKQPA